MMVDVWLQGAKPVQVLGKVLDCETYGFAGQNHTFWNAICMLL